VGEFAGELEERKVLEIEGATRPGCLVGWLQIAQTRTVDAMIGEQDTIPWCLGLQVHSPFSWFSPRIAISKWQPGKIPDRPRMKFTDCPLINGVEILGQAVGWLSDQSSVLQTSPPQGS